MNVTELNCIVFTFQFRHKETARGKCTIWPSFCGKFQRTAVFLPQQQLKLSLQISSLSCHPQTQNLIVRAALSESHYNRLQLSTLNLNTALTNHNQFKFAKGWLLEGL